MSNAGFSTLWIEVDVEALIKECSGDPAQYLLKLECEYPGAELTPYAGLDPRSSMLAGGRLRGNSVAEVCAQAESFNRQGIPIAVALNGSAGKYRRDNAYNHPIDLPNDPVYPLLEILVRGNRQYGVRNSLTLLRDDLLGHLNQIFPDHGLETWASCIRFVGDLASDEYQARLDRALALYDSVVIDNPNTKRILDMESVMKQAQIVDKLVIFLNSKCCIDSRICIAHYENIEKGVDLFQKTQGIIKETLDRCQQDSFALVNQPALLEKTLLRGIRKFKWQRGSSYSFTTTLQLLRSYGVC